MALSDKTGSAVLYLQEELTDARLRCDQLKRLIDRAIRHVGQSKQRDFLYEIAGDLIYGVPDTLFKLDKALDAAALASSRLDYEELKQQLKPEKVEELENVLNEVRIRHIDRRSPHIQPKNPGGVNPPTQEINMFKAASREHVAGALHRIASQIEANQIAPHDVAKRLYRVLMALAKTPAEALHAVRPLNASSPGQVVDMFASANPNLTVDQLTEIGNHWASDDEEKLSRFEEGKPADPTENMSDEDAKKWREENEKNRDNFKSAADKPWDYGPGGTAEDSKALVDLERKGWDWGLSQEKALRKLADEATKAAQKSDLTLAQALSLKEFAKKAKAGIMPVLTVFGRKVQ